MPDFQRAVERRAHTFDLKPLLELLARYGYGRDRVRFRGVSHGATRSLIERVVFSEHEVVIHIALGLLGDNALVPAYYLSEARRSGKLDEFEDFIAFFDHWLIRNYVTAVWPEDDLLVYANYPQLRKALLGITGFNSLGNMVWLTQLLFPDVESVVSRATFPLRLRGAGVHTGMASLDGASVLGGSYEVEAEGFIIELFVDEESDLRDRAWASTLHARVTELLVPLLAPYAIPLRVQLRIREFESALEFAQTYPVPGALGYPVLGGRRDVDAPLVLHNGLPA